MKMTGLPQMMVSLLINLSTSLLISQLTETIYFHVHHFTQGQWCNSKFVFEPLSKVKQLGLYIKQSTAWTFWIFLKHRAAKTSQFLLTV